MLLNVSDAAFFIQISSYIYGGVWIHGGMDVSVKIVFHNIIASYYRPQGKVMLLQASVSNSFHWSGGGGESACERGSAQATPVLT